VLQEELYKKELPNKVGSLNYKDDNKDRYFDQIKAHPPKENCTQLMHLMEKKPDKGNLINRNLIQIIPALDNSHGKLSNLKEVETYKKIPKRVKVHNVSAVSDTYKRKPAGKRAVKSIQSILLTNSASNGLLGFDDNEVDEHVTRKKVVIIGDSHARGYAAMLLC
jgi:hypothetical protein